MHGSVKVLTSIAVIASLFLILVLSAHSETYIGIRTEDVEIITPDGVTLDGVLLAPEKSLNARAFAGVVVCHGFAGNRYQLQAAYSTKLARAGLLVLEFDFRGHGNSGGALSDDETDLAHDVASAVSFLYDRCAGPVFLLGYSIGGGAAIRASLSEPRVEGMIAVAPALDGNAIMQNISTTTPKNLLLIAGGEDTIVPKDDVRLIMRASSGESVPGVTVGDFSNGSARRFEIVEGLDHLELSYSDYAAALALDWLSKCVSNTTPGVMLNERASGSVPALFIAFTSIFIGLALIVPITYVLSRAYIAPSCVLRWKWAGVFEGALAYLLASIVASVLALPVALLFNWLPILLSGFIIAFELVIALVLVLLLASEYRKRKVALNSAFVVDRCALRGMGIGIVMGALALFIIAIAESWAYVDILPTASRLGYSALLFAFLFPSLIIQETYVRRKLHENIGSARIPASAALVWFIASLPLLVIMLVTPSFIFIGYFVFPFILSHGYISAVVYEYTSRTSASALASAFALSIMYASWLPIAVV